MNNAIVEIKKWAGNLVFWEQVALEKVISGKPLEDADYDELLQILLEDSALTNDRTSRSKLNILDSLNETSEEKSKKLLLRIENLVNINALVPNQTLTFSENLTAIYGGNGSGKSGYARVLANAGFSRGDREVLPNITVPVDPAKKLIADIVLLENDSEKKINYILGTACSELQSFYVFDTTSVRVHMNDASQLSFSPAGLSYLTELASVTDEVRVRLNDLIDKYNQPPSFINLFQGDTIVSKTIGELSEDSNIDEIKKLGQLSSEEKKRLSEINLTLANAELDKFHAKIEDLRDKLNVLSIFKNQLMNQAF